MANDLEHNRDYSTKNESYHIHAIEAMISKYSSGLDGNVELPDPKVKRNVLTEVIFLTGSTGNIGSQLLATLLSMDRVRRVYTFNRRSSSNVSMIERHKERFEDRALDVSLLSSGKVVFLEGDIDLPGLGLSEATIIELQKELTMIIHVAWMLSLTRPLSAFEPQVKGTRYLIDLARSSKQLPRFLFASSFRMAQNWDQTKGPYPEELIMDAKYAIGTGYGESKYVVERILAKSGLDATSLRIGQVCGGYPNGAWAISEWFPMSVNISLSLGFIYAPESTILFRWIPMDALSNTILDIGLSNEERLPLTINIEHPRPTPAIFITQAIRSSLIWELELPLHSLPEVSVDMWLDHFRKKLMENSVQGSSSPHILRAFGKLITTLNLSEIHETNTEDGRNPVVDPLFNGMKLSKTMRELEPVDATLVNKWVKYWINSGFLKKRDQPRQSHL